MKIRHGAISAALAMADPQLHRQEVGEQAIGDKCVYTSLTEDNTA